MTAQPDTNHTDDLFDSLSVEELLAIGEGGYADSVRPTRQASRLTLCADAMVLDWSELTASDVAAQEQSVLSGEILGTNSIDIKTLRPSHHRLAQLLAMGMDEIPASRECNYTVAYVSVLKTSPAFQELLAHYSGQVKEEFSDFVTSAGVLAQDFLAELQSRLHEKPEAFTPSSLMEAVRTLADRSGHAPVSKTVNVNVNADSADKLARARERARAGVAALSGTEAHSDGLQ